MTIASIVLIDKIIPHTNADALELAQVKGWQCVVKINEFKAGELAVYVEIDTWIPHSIAPFLSKGQSPRLYEGIIGERLRTVKLRGELSQGLLLPLSVLPADLAVYEHLDVTDVLGILKWHAPVPTALNGEVWPWPSMIPKTDQENIQNIYAEMMELNETKWIIEEKLDGSSCTLYTKQDGTVGVCSRNWEIKQNEANANNSFILAAQRSGLLDALPKLHHHIALQAELCGPGIQGNPYKLDQVQLFIFDIYLIDYKRYAPYEERQTLLESLQEVCKQKIIQVPKIGITKIGLLSLSELLLTSDGRSELGNTQREGLVFKALNLHDGQVPSFKVVSNQFLLKQR